MLQYRFSTGNANGHIVRLREARDTTEATAFAYSLNTVAARLGQQAGFGTVADMAKRFGITTPVDTRPAMVLGTSDVRLIDMTRAYASVASGGTAVTLTTGAKVLALSGLSPVFNSLLSEATSAACLKSGAVLPVLVSSCSSRLPLAS